MIIDDMMMMMMIATYQYPLLTAMVRLKVFKKIDSKEVGKVTFDEIFQYFESPPTIYAKEIFVVMDAVDIDGKVQFGDFVRACGAFCLYGKVEVLK